MLEWLVVLLGGYNNKDSFRMKLMEIGVWC